MYAYFAACVVWTKVCFQSPHIPSTLLHLALAPPPPNISISSLHCYLVHTLLPLNVVLFISWCLFLLYK